MISTERSWLNIITDTDQNQSDAHFALYTDSEGTPAQAKVNFSLNDKDSWISGGEFGIGTNQPDAELHIAHKNDSGDGLKIENSPNSKHWRAFVGSEGNLALYNTTSPNAPIGGFVEESGAYVNVSDRRVKKDIEPTANLLEKVMMLDAKKYHFYSEQPEDNYHYGFIAQDVERVFPEVVYYDEQTDRYFMDYSAFGILAIEAIKEQQTKITALEERLAQIEKLLKNLDD